MLGGFVPLEVLVIYDKAHNQYFLRNQIYWFLFTSSCNHVLTVGGKGVLLIGIMLAVKIVVKLCVLSR